MIFHMELKIYLKYLQSSRKNVEKYCSVKPCRFKIKGFPAENRMLQNFEIPLLTDLGFTNFETHPNSAFPFEGGSRSGMQRIQYYFWETNKLSFYKQTRNGIMGIDYSSKLSSWLSLGHFLQEKYIKK